MTLKVHGIIGYASEPDISEQLHALAHKGLLETLVIEPQDVARHRLRAITDKGIECQIIIPRDQRLSDGAVLRLDEDCAIVVRLQDQQWLRIEPLSVSAGVELGYFCGNLHWRVKFEADHLLIALEGPEADYIDRLDLFFRSGKARRI